MTSESCYISSIDFIQNLDFEYIETYSLQRGKKYEREIQNKEFTEYSSLKRKKVKLNSLEAKRFEYLDKLHGTTQYLVDSNGNFHPSAIKTNIFKKENPVVTKLISILKTKISEIPSWMCAPIYRDAIVFYKHWA